MNYPKLYYTDPEEWKDPRPTIPFYLLITKTYYQIFWDDNSYESKKLAGGFEFVTSIFDQDFRLIDSYGSKKGAEIPRAWFQHDKKLIEYILKYPHEAKELNPKQLLTHHSSQIREKIINILEIEH